ncbi:hypothetical protein [Bradyrhizobium sp. CCBAU 51753]|uniref:hypothetical protein n=1 Tax=Bradyrhizobium sp. CCBAU 51753 TaxID=1325100 RepID=UPI00188D9BE6|nr:hypothetical protein [Bradyrhizobium sp. CCBAU 51753]QOZ23813.1 hypothetical protein XH93_09425 [Bradyrhizobium sp. CCBAU 51753]
MTSEDPKDDSAPAKVARKMADAVTYLSTVADRAGLCTIAEDLRAVRRSLMKETGDGSPAAAAGEICQEDEAPLRKAGNEPSC